jgi:hypothetical protein
MTRGDKVRLAVAAGASVAAMVWFTMKEEFGTVAVIAVISATAGFLAGRKW